MGQSKGVHAAHTFCAGSTCIGFSPQRTEDEPSFRKALDDLLPVEDRVGVKFLFSDSPAKYMARYFPNLIGVAEDILHLVFRVEYCFGGRRTKLSREILSLQQKFLNPPTGGAHSVYEGGYLPREAKEMAVCAREMSRGKWQQYLKKPYKSHKEYASQLERIRRKYPAEMRRTDGAGKKGRSVAEILRAGASTRHYAYLFNNAIFASLGSKTKGTMVNEAVHKKIKNWGAAVTQQHADRMQSVGKVFGLYKLLGRRRPTTRVPESRILALMAGRIESEGIYSLWPRGQTQPVPPEPPQRMDAKKKGSQQRHGKQKKDCAQTEKGSDKRHKLQRRGDKVGAVRSRVSANAL